MYSLFFLFSTVCVYIIEGIVIVTRYNETRQDMYVLICEKQNKVLRNERRNIVTLECYQYLCTNKSDNVNSLKNL